jgi:hypothetical protein
MSPYKIFGVRVEIVDFDSSKCIYTYRFKVDDFALPENVRETFLLFIPMANDTERSQKLLNKETFGKGFIKRIYKAEGVKTYIEFTQASTPYTTSLCTMTSYEARFLPNDVTYQACLKALSSIRDKGLEEYFNDFDSIPRMTTIDRDITFKDDEFIWFNSKIINNEEQKTAIKNIVNCTSYPHPYCIFGPPGNFLKIFLII